MPTTPTYAFRYPAGGDPPDVPTDIQHLASDVEAAIGDLGYAQVTGSVTITSATESAPTDVVTLPSITFDGGPVWIEFYTPYLEVVAGGNIWLSAYQDGTQLGRFLIATTPTTGGTMRFPGSTCRRKHTPAAGAHVLKVGGICSPSGQIVGAGGATVGGYMPCYMRVSKT